MENTVVTIDVPGEFSDEDYRSIIEKGLLMHGYALVPSGGNLFKLVAAESGGSLPSAQNVPMMLRDLPACQKRLCHGHCLQGLTSPMTCCLRLPLPSKNRRRGSLAI